MRTTVRTITVDVAHFPGDSRLERLSMEESALIGALRETRRLIEIEKHRLDMAELDKANRRRAA